MIHPTDLVENQTVKAQRHLPMNPSCRTREIRRNKQIQGRAWNIRGEITTNLLHNDSVSIDCDDDDEEAKIQNIKSQTEAALGAAFENLFRKKHPDVRHFVFSCNLVNILHAGPAAAATKIKVDIRGFLRLGTPTALTALDKLLCFPVSAFFFGKWERCEGGLLGNKENETCRAVNSPWMPIQTRGEFGNSNKGRAANKSPQTAVIGGVGWRGGVQADPPPRCGAGPRGIPAQDRAAYRRGGAARRACRPRPLLAHQTWAVGRMRCGLIAESLRTTADADEDASYRHCASSW